MVTSAHCANNYTPPLTHHPCWGTIRPPASKLRVMEIQLLWLKPHLVPSCVAAAVEVSTPWAALHLPCPPWHQRHLPPGRKTPSQTGPSWKQQHWSLQATCPWVLVQPRMHIYNGQWLSQRMTPSNISNFNPSLPQPVQFSDWNMHGRACKTVYFLLL